MNDYIKDKLIESIIEADLIIDEINNQYWENKWLRLIFIILILSFGFFIIRVYYEEQRKYNKNI